MTKTEGLAIVSAHNFQRFAELFLDAEGGPRGRNLNPARFYLACRWDYHVMPHRFLERAQILVTNYSTGEHARARAVDWGPNIRTGRIADLSPGLADELGLGTDDICEVRVEHE